VRKRGSAPRWGRWTVEQFKKGLGIVFSQLEQAFLLQNGVRFPRRSVENETV